MAASESDHTNLVCVDLSNLDLDKSAALIRQACLDSGFFYVINHGITQQSFDELFEQCHRFFALPKEEKMNVLRNDNFRGYTPLLDEILDPSKQTKAGYVKLNLKGRFAFTYICT
eukprot:Gb_01161 [translate_table: standard]